MSFQHRPKLKTVCWGNINQSFGKYEIYVAVLMYLDVYCIRVNILDNVLHTGMLKFIWSVNKYTNVYQFMMCFYSVDELSLLIPLVGSFLPSCLTHADISYKGLLIIRYNTD
jgi:hypothetical protein